MSPATADQPQIVLIGRPDPIFSQTAQWLRRTLRAAITAEFPSIRLAFKSPQFSESLPDLAVVFREHCDQFSTREIQQLIGVMIFRRVVCCDGPLCISDGRTHGQWPAICRVPSNSAESVIQYELDQLACSAAPVSPMAASEDVFARRTDVFPQKMAGFTSPLRAFVAASDIAYRNTTREILHLNGVQAEAGDTHVLSVLLHVSGLKPNWILIDLDDDPAEIEAELLAAASTGLHVTAMTAFPGQRRPAWAHSLVEKHELFLQLGALNLELSR
jgi:hypothetical protein